MNILIKCLDVFQIFEAPISAVSPVCSAGYEGDPEGGDGDGVTCTACVLSYHPGGVAGVVDCIPCPMDTVSPDGATERADCQSTFSLFVFRYFIFCNFLSHYSFSE